MGTKFLINSVSNNLCAGKVGSKSQAQLLIVTGIEELSDWGIRVAPNPTEGVLTLMNVVQDARLNVYDAMGKVVLEKVLSQGDNLIDMGGQASGIYFFSVESSTKKVVLKVQKY
ncbi:T9SS type A sorting domain-containing protein [Flectobacillus roseus]